MDKVAVPVNTLAFLIFNFVLTLIGIAYLGYGSWLIDLISDMPKLKLFYFYYTSMGSVMIIVGIFSILLSAFGYYVTVKRQSKNLYAYLIILMFVMMFGVAVGIAGLAYSAQTPSRVNEEINFKFFNSTNSGDILIVDYLQETFECCGINLATDWTLFLGKTKIPNSCCVDEDSCTEYFKVGCFAVVQEKISTDLTICGGVSITIALAMLIGLILTVSRIFENNERQFERKYLITQN